MKIELEIQRFLGEISVIYKIIANSKSKMNMTILESKVFIHNANIIISRAGSGQSPARNLARGPLFLSGPTQPGPHFCRPVVARGNILLARMARI